MLNLKDPLQHKFGRIPGSLGFIFNAGISKQRDYKNGKGNEGHSVWRQSNRASEVSGGPLRSGRYRPGKRRENGRETRHGKAPPLAEQNHWVASLFHRIADPENQRRKSK